MPIILYTAGFKPFLQIVIGDAFSQNKKAFRHAGRQMNHNLLDRFQFCFNFRLFDAQDTAEERSFGQGSSRFSSTIKPGPSVDNSNKMPFGSLKYSALK